MDMKTARIRKLTGASILALGLSVAPLSAGLVQAQDGQSATESPSTEAMDSGETAGQNFEESEAALERAGQEAIQGVEAAGEAAQQGVQDAAQDASQAAQDAAQDAQQTATEAADSAAAAAERAELAAENAAADIQESFDWGWLGLLGLIGLFGLAGGKKRQVEVDERHHTPSTTTGSYR
jgi:hypothetical protein